MFKRYSFLLVFSVLFAILGWWSGRVDSHAALAGASVLHAEEREIAAVGEASRRRELLEVMDRIVVYEHYYRSVYGHFTKFLSRAGFPVPAHVALNYEIRVAEASAEKLVLTAFSENLGRIVDQVSVDQAFKVNANFQIPAPRAEYLKTQALKQLRGLRDSAAGQIAEEQGIFRNFFRFEVRKDSQDRRIAFAVGLRPPVAGVHLEIGPTTQDSLLSADVESGLRYFSELAEVDLSVVSTGQLTGGDVPGSSEQTQLAQKIFYGEMGRYAKTWSELSRIANFQSQDYMTDGVKAGQNSSSGSQDPGRWPSAAKLEIEPIPSDE